MTETQEESVYKFIERVGSKITKRCNLRDNPAFYLLHADKSRQYQEEWEAAGIPFLYAAFIYAMSYSYPFCIELDRTKVVQWVIDYWNGNKHFQRVIKEEDTGKAYFTIYWLDGKREVIPAKPGEEIHEAFARAGYRNGATKAIDWYDYGDTNTSEWNNSIKQWVSRSKPTVVAVMTRQERVMDTYNCSVEDAQRFIDLRDEGYSTYEASVMAGLADPHE